MNCESKTKSKLTAYPTLQAECFITQKNPTLQAECFITQENFFFFFWFIVMFPKVIYKVYVFKYSFFHFKYLQFFFKKKG